MLDKLFGNLDRKLAYKIMAFHIFIIAFSNYIVQFTFDVFGHPLAWAAFTFPLVVVATDLTVRMLGKEMGRQRHERQHGKGVERQADVHGEHNDDDAPQRGRAGAGAVAFDRSLHRLLCGVDDLFDPGRADQEGSRTVRLPVRAARGHADPRRQPDPPRARHLG